MQQDNPVINHRRQISKVKTISNHCFQSWMCFYLVLVINTIILFLVMLFFPDIRFVDVLKHLKMVEKKKKLVFWLHWSTICDSRQWSAIPVLQFKCSATLGCIPALILLNQMNGSWPGLCKICWHAKEVTQDFASGVGAEMDPKVARQWHLRH